MLTAKTLSNRAHVVGIIGVARPGALAGQRRESGGVSVTEDKQELAGLGWWKPDHSR